MSIRVPAGKTFGVAEEAFELVLFFHLESAFDDLAARKIRNPRSWIGLASAGMCAVSEEAILAAIGSIELWAQH